MSKRRHPDANWFTLPYDERKELMYEHGASGRNFAGRVLQVITGSTGLDDYEWGVTLFAVHPDDLKEVVYTMRFDRASADLRRLRPVLRRHGHTDRGRWSTRLLSTSPSAGQPAVTDVETQLGHVDAVPVEPEPLEPAHQQVTVRSQVYQTAVAVVVDVATSQQQLGARGEGRDTTIRRG
jgi:hypothetical protein